MVASTEHHDRQRQQTRRMGGGEQMKGEGIQFTPSPLFTGLLPVRAHGLTGGHVKAYRDGWALRSSLRRSE